MSRILIRGGEVLGGSGDGLTLTRADVLIEGDRIADISADLPSGSAEVVEAAGGIVMPGLVDTHCHVTDAVFSQATCDVTLREYLTGMRFAFDPESIHVATRAGARRAIDAGITTIVDWSLSSRTLDSARAAVDGHREAGARVAFAYGPGAGAIGNVPDFDAVHEEIRTLQRETADDRVQIMLAAGGPEFLPMDVARDEIELARSLGVMASMHVGGLTKGTRGKVLEADAAGLLGPDLQFAHCCMLSDQEFAAMAGAGVAASLSPFAEATMGLGPSPYIRLRDAGVRVGLATDSVALTGRDLFSEARVLLALERARVHQATLSAGTDPETTGFLTAAELVLALTAGGAASIGLGESAGVVRAGMLADVIVVGGRELGARPYDVASGLLLSGGAAAVQTVIIDGIVRKREGRLVDQPSEDVLSDLETLRAPERRTGSTAQESL